MSFSKAILSAFTASVTLVTLACASIAACSPQGTASAPPAPWNLPDPLAAGWKGQSVCERLQDDEEQRALRCTFPPGVGHERHFHAPHFGYVIAGSVMRITDESGTREVSIETGTSWTSDGTAWHEVVNVGETTGVYLIVEPKPSG